MSENKILITAGPTYEPIDPVRFIGNRSSGKMGYAIAESFAEKGFEVFLISGPSHLTVSHPLITLISVETADQMFNESKKIFPDCIGAVMAAAVSDYTPEIVSSEKIKKGDSAYLEIRLRKTIDILAYLGQTKKTGQILAGFSLETNNELDNAKRKLYDKNADFMVLNSLNDSGVGFGADTNRITILYRSGEVVPFPVKTKKEVAADIVDAFISLLP